MRVSQVQVEQVSLRATHKGLFHCEDVPGLCPSCQVCTMSFQLRSRVVCFGQRRARAEAGAGEGVGVGLSTSLLWIGCDTRCGSM